MHFGLCEADAAALAALFSLCMPNPWSETAFSAGLQAPGSLALGMAAARRQPLAGAILFRDLGGEAELLLIGVHPAQRRRGIARALMAAGLALLKGSGVSQVHLEVDAHNLSARRLYEKCGFTETGRRAGYYPAQKDQPAHDAILMRLNLQDGCG